MKAFTEELPVNEKWYQDRIAICDACELNTKNMDKASLSAADKLKLTIHFCPEGDHCTACGCCTHEKSSQKGEECGMAEINWPPKWPALEVESKLDRRISAENLSPEAGVLRVGEKHIVYDLGETSQERIDFSILIKRKGGLDVQSAVAGCRCAVANTEIIDKNSAKFQLTISTKDFKKGIDIKRAFTVNHYITNRKVKATKIIIKVKMK